jgi:hypothetical protein
MPSGRGDVGIDAVAAATPSSIPTSDDDTLSERRNADVNGAMPDCVRRWCDRRLRCVPALKGRGGSTAELVRPYTKLMSSMLALSRNRRAFVMTEAPPIAAADGGDGPDTIDPPPPNTGLCDNVSIRTFVCLLAFRLDPPTVPRIHAAPTRTTVVKCKPICTFHHASFHLWSRSAR